MSHVRSCYFLYHPGGPGRRQASEQAATTTTNNPTLNSEAISNKMK